MDLNKLILPFTDDDAISGVPLKDHSTTVDGGNIAVYFRNIEARLVEHIREADCVLGCMAWLTSKPVLHELAQKRGVSIVVQKEDFFRRDANANKDSRLDLRRCYQALIPRLRRRQLGLLLASMRQRPYENAAEELEAEWFIDDAIDPIRCVGCWSPADRSQPRAHHKFFVFCRYVNDDEEDTVVPYAVWTGSYNASFNATRSLENAVVIRNPDIAGAYFLEYAQIAAVSESLDWTRSEPSPEWLLGG